jgi:hypothetical protein
MGDRGERPLVLFCVAVAALWAALAAAVARGAPPPPAPPLLGGGGRPPAAPELIDIDVSVWWYVYRTPAGAYAVGRDSPPGWVERFLLRSQADRYANRLNSGLEVKRRVRAAVRASAKPWRVVGTFAQGPAGGPGVIVYYLSRRDYPELADACGGMLWARKEDAQAFADKVNADGDGSRAPATYHAPPPAPVIVPFGAVQSIRGFAPGEGGNFAGAIPTWPLTNRPARAAGMFCGPSG